MAHSRPPAETEEPLPIVEIVLGDVDTSDWVTETLGSLGASFRLLACRPTDRGRHRLLRLFELRTGPDGLGPVVRRLRSRLASRDLTVSSLGPDRALLRVSVPMPATCAAAFDLGDFCITCPYSANEVATKGGAWKVLVPQIVDARRLLSASARSTGPRPQLVRAGAYRRAWGLTGRQERALREAFQIGYFDYPRRASLATLASRLGVTRSTALELLRKGTTKLAAQRFFEEPSLEQLP
ncbi:MAG TPA: helix-turn-helix domain-containing protein [Thermoplasmata archaeon]|jgi:hypothetical protein|nr:helix-turn-helix domain-containing protein [Thermoplasmata archaeon]